MFIISGTTQTPLKHLLHVEDNLADAELVRELIREEWADCAIQRVETHGEFLAALQNREFDLILSDFTLPTFNGMEALKLAREQSSGTPFLFLSGTIGENNAVEALQRGASDYLIKDRPARLIPAIRAALEKRNEYKLRGLAEQKLREQAELLDKARDAICVTDMQGRITYWNQTASQLFGWKGDEGRGQRLEDLFGSLNRSLMSGALLELQAQGAWSKDLQLASVGGEFRHIETRWTLVRDASNQPKSILLINTDVTEQKKLEAQILRSQRLEGIGTLAGGIAHDLNNVLAPILMAVNLLQHELVDDRLLRIVGVLEKSALHGTSLIRQVLAFARGAEGERTKLQLQLVVQDVVTLLKETLPRAITIETTIPPDLWHVMGNSTQLNQVLMNLGVNARDAMTGRGQLRIQASNLIVDEALARANSGARVGPHVLITVADTGSGIPPELINRIFDPFFTTKVAGKGTGLGLSTVLGIIKGHGGFLQVLSEPGQGTEFRLYFPADVTEAKVQATEVAVALPRGHGETILVIDDDEGVRELACAVLERQGYEVLVAADGLSGITLYREHQTKVRAILTDLMMPGLQGAEVVRELRGINPDARIVVMSGLLGEQTAVAPEPGRLTFLEKPMSGKDLVRRVQSVLTGVAPG